MTYGGQADGQEGGQEGGLPSLIHSLGSVINSPLFQLLSNSLIAEINIYFNKNLV
jgi:hypothetical protein